MRETIVNSRLIYNGRIIKLEVHDVVLSNGDQTQREIVNHPGAVAMVPLDDEHNILMVRQFRLAANRVMLEIPAGTLELDESPVACAERELQEEIGYKPGLLKPVGGIFVAPGYTTEFIHMFLATDLMESSLEMDSDEFIEVERIAMADALNLIETGEIVDAKTATGILMVARRLGF
jgi:ADP-ribose pyrophosphatase